MTTRLNQKQKVYYRFGVDEYGRWTAICPSCGRVFVAQDTGVKQFTLAVNIDRHIIDGCL